MFPVGRWAFCLRGDSAISYLREGAGSYLPWQRRVFSAGFWPMSKEDSRLELASCMGLRETYMLCR